MGIITPKTYSSRKAAIVGARRALETVFNDGTLVGVHFNPFLVEGAPYGEAWSWEPLTAKAKEACGVILKDHPVAVAGPATPQADALDVLGLSGDTKAAIMAVLGLSGDTKAAIKSTDAHQPPTPPVASTPRELWRRAKTIKPSKISYRPKAGSVQAQMYTLLTATPPVTIEAFCAAMPATGTKDKVFLTPPRAWSRLNYLFVTQKGYGLDFDGTHIRLLVPTDERDALPRGA
jgi:hypothetical protein